MADAFQAIIETLATTGIPAGERLPPDFDKQPLPRIHVQPLPPGRTIHGFNAIGMMVLTFDVDVYVSPEDYNSGKAWTIANAVRKALYNLRTKDGVRALGTGVVEKRPAYNDNIYRLGFTIDVAQP